MADTVEVEPKVVKKDKPSPTKQESGSEDTGSEDKSSGQTSPELNGSKTAEGSPDPESKEPSTSPVETTDSDVQMSDTAEGSTDPEAKSSPSPVDSGPARMSESPEGEGKDKPSGQSGLPSDGKAKVPEDDCSSVDSDDSDEMNEVYKRAFEELNTTPLEKILEKVMRDVKLSDYPSDDDDGDACSSDGGNELDLTDIDKKEFGKDSLLPSPTKQESGSEDLLSPISVLKSLKACLINILEYATRCYTRNIEMSRLERIIQRLKIIEEDAWDLASVLFPVRDLSDVKSLATLLRYLAGKGKTTVNVEEVHEKTDKARVLTYYRGFSSFRRADYPELDHALSQFEKQMKKWEAFLPYLKAYTEETSALKDMKEKWKTVKMTVSELRDWKTGLEDLVKTRDNLYLLLKVILRDIEAAFDDLRDVWKSLIFDLNFFLNADISSMFEVPSKQRCYVEIMS